jgi:hypothetical protein
VNVEAKDGCGCTPLYTAAENGHDAVVTVPPNGGRRIW